MLEDEYFLGTKLYNKQFIEICKPITEHLGIVSSIYINIDAQGRLLTIYSQPQWGENVLEKKHYKVEPGIVHPANMHNGFVFCNASDHQEYKDELLYDGAVNFGWWHAFVYAEKNPNDDGYFLFGFATTKENYRMNSIVMNESSIIRKTLRKLNRKLLLNNKDIDDHRMNISALKGEEFNTQKGVVFHPEHEKSHKIALLHEVLGGADCKNLLKKPLSAQEINCLRFYTTSHSIKRVARDINLAITTVTSYIENIKTKLNCNTKNELLEKAEILQALGHI